MGMGVDDAGESRAAGRIQDEGVRLAGTVAFADLDDISLDNLLAVLGACPLLQNLCISTVSEQVAVRPMDLQLPSLQKLVLAHIDVARPEILLGHITAPSLAKLSMPTGLGLTCNSPQAWLSLASFLHRSTCSLSIFEIHAPNEQEQYLADLLTSSCFSRTVELTILSQITEVMMVALTVDSGSPPLLPKLSNLWIKEYIGRSGSFSQMVLSRTRVLQYVRTALHLSLEEDFLLSVPTMTLDLVAKQYIQ